MLRRGSVGLVALLDSEDGRGRIVLQLDVNIGRSAAVVAEFGDGLMVAPPAAPAQDEVQRGPHHPTREFPHQTSHFLNTEADEDRPRRPRNAPMRLLRCGGPRRFGTCCSSSGALAMTRAAARNACATRHNVMWRYHPRHFLTS